MSKLNIYILLLVALIFSSCKKDEVQTIIPLPIPTDSTKYFNLELHFDNVFNTQDLILDSVVYNNNFEEPFTIRRFNYFISNIELIKNNDSVFKVNQDSSYFLIKETDAASHKCRINNIPLGEYKSIRFLIGVDSLRNTMNISKRTGVLDVGAYASDMYWTWNQGYIFLKLEMREYKAKGDTSEIVPYVYHIGGYGGMNTPTINNIKTVQLDLNQNLTNTENRTSKIFFKADAFKVISGIHEISLDSFKTVMLTPFSAKVAENYSKMFSIERVEN